MVSSDSELFAVLFSGLSRSTYFKVVGKAVVVLVVDVPRLVAGLLAELLAKLLAGFSLTVDAFDGELPIKFSIGAGFLSRGDVWLLLSGVSRFRVLWVVALFVRLFVVDCVGSEFAGLVCVLLPLVFEATEETGDAAGTTLSTDKPATGAAIGLAKIWLPVLFMLVNSFVKLAVS